MCWRSAIKVAFLIAVSWMLSLLRKSQPSASINSTLQVCRLGRAVFSPVGDHLNVHQTWCDVSNWWRRLAASHSLLFNVSLRNLNYASLCLIYKTPAILHTNFTKCIDYLLILYAPCTYMFCCKFPQIL